MGILEFLHDILKNDQNGPDLTFLSPYHWLYIAMTLLLIMALCTFFLNRPKTVQRKFMWGLAIFLLVSYLLDLALQPIIFLGESTVAEAIINKLPFHLSTLNAFLILLAMLIKKDWFRNLAVVYAMFAGAIFLVAPQTYVQGGYSPYCYQVMQTFAFHGATLCWAVFAVFSGFVEPKFPMAFWAELSLPAIGAWAEIGNLVFYSPTRNFMFLHHDVTGLTTGYWYLLLYAVIGLVVFIGYFSFFDFVFPGIRRKLGLH